METQRSAKLLSQEKLEGKTYLRVELSEWTHTQPEGRLCQSADESPEGFKRFSG